MGVRSPRFVRRDEAHLKKAPARSPFGSAKGIIICVISTPFAAPHYFPPNSSGVKAIRLARQTIQVCAPGVSISVNGMFFDFSQLLEVAIIGDEVVAGAARDPQCFQLLGLLGVKRGEFLA